ncbi:UNVERIFIED_CONTAM: hypothetical protein Sradi_4390200 [Sesamum radiatum]|uniref:Uncharacterized protein n=1 Tax=Sesamum radiatum TaxID=300843 RepID=A0AAW2NP96_SESRA
MDGDSERAKCAHVRVARIVMEIDDKVPVGGLMTHFGPADAQGLSRCLYIQYEVEIPIGDKVGETKGDQYTARKCYVEAIKSSNSKMEVDLLSKESSRQGNQKDVVPTHVQQVEELLSIQLVHGEIEKIPELVPNWVLH